MRGFDRTMGVYDNTPQLQELFTRDVFESWARSIDNRNWYLLSGTNTFFMCSYGESVPLSLAELTTEIMRVTQYTNDYHKFSNRFYG